MLYKFCKNWISVPNIVHQLTLSLRCNPLKIQNSSDFQDAINSLRRSANGRSEANDVSILWRHSSWSLRGGLNVPIEGHFLTVFGNLNPKNVVGHRVDHKKHFLTSQRVFWAIVREISRTMAQNTRCDVRKCFLWSTRWPTTFLGFKFPKTVKKWPSIGTFKPPRRLQDEWRHRILTSFASLRPLAERRKLFIASWKSLLFCIFKGLQRNDSVSWCTIFGTEIQFLQNLYSICRQSVLLWYVSAGH